MNSLSGESCQNAGGMPVGLPLAATDVPWTGPARRTKSSRAARTDGHHFTAQRGMFAPWLWPTMSTLRPDAAWMVCTARATYSALICWSPKPRSG